MTPAALRTRGREPRAPAPVRGRGSLSRRPSGPSVAPGVQTLPEPRSLVKAPPRKLRPGSRGLCSDDVVHADAPGRRPGLLGLGPGASSCTVCPLPRPGGTRRPRTPEPTPRSPLCSAQSRQPPPSGPVCLPGPPAQSWDSGGPSPAPRGPRPPASSWQRVAGEQAGRAPRQAGQMPQAASGATGPLVAAPLLLPGLGPAAAVSGSVCPPCPRAPRPHLSSQHLLQHREALVFHGDDANTTRVQGQFQGGNSTTPQKAHVSPEPGGRGASAGRPPVPRSAATAAGAADGAASAWGRDSPKAPETRPVTAPPSPAQAPRLQRSAEHRVSAPGPQTPAPHAADPCPPLPCPGPRVLGLCTEAVAAGRTSAGPGCPHAGRRPPSGHGVGGTSTGHPGPGSRLPPACPFPWFPLATCRAAGPRVGRFPGRPPPPVPTPRPHHPGPRLSEDTSGPRLPGPSARAAAAFLGLSGSAFPKTKLPRAPAASGPRSCPQGEGSVERDPQPAACVEGDTRLAAAAPVLGRGDRDVPALRWPQPEPHALGWATSMSPAAPGPVAGRAAGPAGGVCGPAPCRPPSGSPMSSAHTHRSPSASAAPVGPGPAFRPLQGVSRMRACVGAVPAGAPCSPSLEPPSLTAGGTPCPAGSHRRETGPARL